MNPRVEEMLLRQRHDELIRKAEHHRLVSELKRARRDRLGAVRSAINQLAAIVGQHNSNVSGFSALRVEKPRAKESASTSVPKAKRYLPRNSKSA